MKKIAIFSDIHGNYQALQSILNDIKNKYYDEIIYLGDALSLGPQSKECLELFKNSNIRFLLGNHELYFLKGNEIDDGITSKLKIEHIDWVRSLFDKSDEEYLKKCDLTYEIKTLNGKKILFEHFLIKDISELYPYEDNTLETDLSLWYKYKNEYEYIIIGHEHKILSEPNSNLWIVGSAGCTKDNITTYTSLEIGDTLSISRVFINYDRFKFEKEINKRDYPFRNIIKKDIFGIIKE